MQSLITDNGIILLIGLIGSLAIILIGCMFVGAYIAYRCFKIGMGSQEGLFGSVPKGEVFNISEPEAATGLAPEEDESVNHIIDKTNRFLQALKGGK